MRKPKNITTGEIYHIYNRGVDKRDIFLDFLDIQRFSDALIVFNNIEPVESLNKQIRLNGFAIKNPLVSFLAYSLQPNHFHFLIQQEVDGGISEFMKRLQGGYTLYLNNKNERSGALFEATYKSKHVNTNEYLLYVSGYINLNDDQENNRGLTPINYKYYSSWSQYVDYKYQGRSICTKHSLILQQFETKDEYKKYAYQVLEEVKNNKKRYRLLGKN